MSNQAAQHLSELFITFRIVSTQSVTKQLDKVRRERNKLKQMMTSNEIFIHKVLIILPLGKRYRTKERKKHY